MSCDLDRNLVVSASQDGQVLSLSADPNSDCWFLYQANIPHRAPLSLVVASYGSEAALKRPGTALRAAASHWPQGYKEGGWCVTC